MTNSGALAATRRYNLRFLAPAALLLMVVFAVAIPYRSLVNIDDAYITYRYAENLARYGRLAYNLEGDKAFAATAPGYEVILAGLARLGAEVQPAGYLLGALSILLAGLALADLLADRPEPLVFGTGVSPSRPVLALRKYSLAAPAAARGGSTRLTLDIKEVSEPARLRVELWDGPGQRAAWAGEVNAAGPGKYDVAIEPGEGEPASEGELRLRARTAGAHLYWIDVSGHQISDYAALTPIALVDRP